MDQSKILMFSEELTLYHTVPTFNNPRGRSLLKTLWEKEKMLVASIFSFSHNVFCCTKDRNHHLAHYQTTNFRLFQTERVCRQQFQYDENGRKLSKQVENTVGKGEIALFEQFLLFLQCFQKGCFPGASKGVIVWEWVK